MSNIFVDCRKSKYVWHEIRNKKTSIFKLLIIVQNVQYLTL